MKKEKEIPKADYLPCKAAMKSLFTYFLSEADYLREAMGEQSYFDLLISMTTLEGWLDNLQYAFQDFAKKWAARDEAMAHNLVYSWGKIDHYQRKAVFVAHTAHVSKMGSSADWWKQGRVRLHGAGYFLNSYFKHQYKTIAFSGYQVSGSDGVYSQPESPDSLDFQMHLQDRKLSMIDTRGRFIRKKKRWWIHNENSEDHYINGVFLKLKDHFDGVIYFPRTDVANLISRDTDVFNP